MTYSCSDFTSDIVGRMEAQKLIKIPRKYDDDPGYQAGVVLAAIEKLTTDRAALLAALNGLLSAGNYNNEGEWVLPAGQWDGQGEPPDTCDHPAMEAANAAIAQAEQVQS